MVKVPTRLDHPRLEYAAPAVSCVTSPSRLWSHVDITSSSGLNNYCAENPPDISQIVFRGDPSIHMFSDFRRVHAFRERVPTERLCGTRVFRLRLCVSQLSGHDHLWIIGTAGSICGSYDRRSQRSRCGGTIQPVCCSRIRNRANSRPELSAIERQRDIHGAHGATN